MTLVHKTLSTTPLDEWSAPDAETSTWQHTNTCKRRTSMPSGGIRTRNPRKRAAAYSRHWDRLTWYSCEHCIRDHEICHTCVIRDNQKKFVKLWQGRAERQKHFEERGMRGKILNKNSRLGRCWVDYYFSRHGAVVVSYETLVKLGLLLLFKFCNLHIHVVQDYWFYVY